MTDEPRDLNVVLAAIQERFGDDGLQAVSAFLFALGSEAYIAFDENDQIPADIVMQMAWQLSRDQSTPKASAP